ncbi:hypothetical protein FRB91_000879 [Serendipita sp. 411]|nr:hypothetical protein FRB91_000879 [Serendipita sp. 411]
MNPIVHIGYLPRVKTMSTPIAKLAQLLVASETKRLLAVNIQTMVKNAIVAEEAKIATLPAKPNGYVVVESIHTSRVDPSNHVTVDVYSSDANGIDQPIGCLHVYTDNRLEVFDVRSKAQRAYEERVTQGNKASIIDLFYTK